MHLQTGQEGFMLANRFIPHQGEYYHTAGVQVFRMKRISTVISMVLFTGLSLCAYAEEQNLPEFEASYDVYRSGIKIARMQRSFVKQPDGNFEYRSETNVTGIASMFRKDRIIEQSIWDYTYGRVMPLYYEYEHSGTSKERNVTVEFDWKKKLITNSVNGAPWRMPTSEGILDKLLYQYVIMLDMQAGKTSLSYTVADGGVEKIYIFEKLGEETLDTALGKMKTIKMSRHRPDSDRESIFWSAPEIGYLAVKLENTDDGVKTIVLIKSLTGYGFEKVTQK